MWSEVMMIAEISASGIDVLKAAADDRWLFFVNKDQDDRF